MLEQASNLPDFTEVDENLFDILEIENDNEIQFNDHINLTLNNILLERFTQDTQHVNNYGKKLLNMCLKTKFICISPQAYSELINT